MMFWKAQRVLALALLGGLSATMFLTLLWYAVQGWDPVLINGRWMVAAGNTVGHGGLLLPELLLLVGITLWATMLVVRELRVEAAHIPPVLGSPPLPRGDSRGGAPTGFAWGVMMSKIERRVGFTLADLVLAVAILALVAGVVVPKVGPFVAMGEEEDRDNELHFVQSAVSAMMIDNNTIRIRPAREPTGDMSAFPDPVSPVWWKGLGPGDAPGYVLYGHDKTPDGGTDVLEYYITSATTTYCYTADRDGSVTQQTARWNATTSSCE